MSQPEPANFPYPSPELEHCASRLAGTALEQLFDTEDNRVAEFSCEAAGWRLDYSRHMLDSSARSALLALCEKSGLEQQRDRLFAGDRINHTEDRAVLHTLLRAPAAPQGLHTEWHDVEACLEGMGRWVDAIQTGNHKGYSGQAITDIVNIGIGGSDLGPRMVTQALAPYHSALRVHFVANIDPSELARTLAELDPAQTLFIVCSKTLSTEETLHNTRTARQWLLDSAGDESAIASHFLAVSTNLAAAKELGIPSDNIMPMWDWVGGRYSLWSAVGWSIAFATSMDCFRKLLQGAAEMDAHFQQAPASTNMPVIMSLLEIWYVNFLNSANHAVIPYDHSLRRLPAFLQQLSMESNGKRVNHSGQTLAYATAPALWGEEGTNGQHSFHQLLHQGTQLCPVDFILPLRSHQQDEEAQERLVANCLGQAQALLQGRSYEQSLQSLLDRGIEQSEAQSLAHHLVIPGNRPSSTLSCEQLTPESLGALIALYEHKTFCSGHIWQINSFDQWGVELGKQLSGTIRSALRGDSSPSLDPSTAQQIRGYRDAR